MCDWCDYIAANRGRADDEVLREEYTRIWRRRTKAQIAEYGWTYMSVEEWPWLSYTIGWWSRGRAELCVFGLEPPVARSVLRLAGMRVEADGPINDGDELYENGWELRAFTVPNPGEVLLRANDYYRRKPRNSVPALQLVYPDVHGVWPWEPDCHLFPGSQPMPGDFAA